MIVKLKKDYKKYNLVADKNYNVLGIEADDYRIINENNEPILYPTEIFDIIDNTEPDDWITEYGEDGERYSYPKELMSIGFFEDYFDGNKKVEMDLKNYILSHST